jgi:hypothetical protein
MSGGAHRFVAWTAPYRGEVFAVRAWLPTANAPARVSPRINPTIVLSASLDRCGFASLRISCSFRVTLSHERGT